jgi:hypothetical protein
MNDSRRNAQKTLTDTVGNFAACSIPAMTIRAGGPVIVCLQLLVSHAEEMPLPELFRCPCCLHKTLENPDALGLCPVCWWEDDGQDSDDEAEVRATVNGDLSLSEARRNFQMCGAAHPRFVRYVRKAEPGEE